MIHPMQVYLERPRVDSLFLEAIKRPVVSVIAGAGYGKTHALYSFIHRHSLPSFWITLTERDNNRDRFWENFYSVVRVYNEENADLLKDLGFPCTERKIKRYLEMPYKDLGLGKFLVVFDDLHTIHNQDVLHFVDRSITLFFPGVCSVLVSRCEIPVNLVSIEAKGFLAKIGQEDLKFSMEEQNHYFRLRGIHHVGQAARDIYRSTEGWVFAIRLAGEVLVREQDRGLTLAQSGPEVFKANIFKLIEKEIVAVVSEELKKFLIKLSLFHVHNGGLLEEIGGAALMEELNRIGAFIDLDTYTDVYHIHPLLLEYLQSQQEKLSKKEKREVYLKAAAWCFSKDQKLSAFGYFAKAGDYQGLYRVFDSYPLVISNDVARVMLEIMLNIPERFYDEDPRAYVVKARLLSIMGRFEEAVAEIDRTIVKLEERDQTANPAITPVLGELYINRGLLGYFYCHLTGDYGFIEDFKKASEYMKYYPAPLKPPLTIYPVDTFLCRVGVPGREEMEKYLDMLGVYSSYLSEAMAGMSCGVEDAARAELAYYRMDMPLAEELSYRGLKKAREQHQYEIENRALFFLLRIAIYRGDVALIKTVLREQENMLSEQWYYNRKVNADLLISWFYVQLEENDRVVSWIKSSFEESDLNSLIDGLERLVKARYHLFFREYPQALSCLEDGNGGHSLNTFLLGRIVTGTLEAVCRYKSGDREKSFLALKTACDLAEPNGLFLPFVELGRHMRSLSAAALEEPETVTGIKREILERIHVASSAYAKRLALVKKEFQEEKTGDDKSGKILSPRERIILTGLYHGLTGEEIAHEAGLSINTVKSVIKRIYNKFGALNKADAIRIALEQGILRAEKSIEVQKQKAPARRVKSLFSKKSG